MLPKMSRILFYCSTVLCYLLSSSLFAGQIARVSVSSKGAQYSTASSQPVLSAEGRTVVFSSVSNGIAGIFIHDRWTHKTDLIVKGLKNQTISDLNLSANGRYVGFSITDKTAKEVSQRSIFFVYDHQLRKTEQVVNNVRSVVYMSADARYVALNNENGIAIHDRLLHKTEQLKIVLSGIMVALSAEGRYVVLASDTPDPEKTDTNRVWDIFVYDRQTSKTERVSVSSKGEQGNYGTGYRASISADGRYVAFSSWASNLVAGDTNDKADLFIHDRLTHKTERVSIGAMGVQGNKSSEEVSMSADGRHIAFASSASNLVANDTNQRADIFVHDRVMDNARRADLSVVATKNPTAVKLDAKGDYLFTITNQGKDAVNDVVFLQVISDVRAVSFKPSQGSCNASTVETVCHLGYLAAGKQLTVQVSVTAQSQDFSQQVTVSGAPVDATTTNNVIEILTPVK